jgi:hypothetical protein
MLRSQPWLGWPLLNIRVTNTSRSVPQSCLITGVVTRLTRRELLSLLEHMNSPLVFSGVHVTRSLVLYLCFVDRCLSFYTLSFDHFVVCSSSIYGFWWSCWYLQTLLSQDLDFQRHVLLCSMILCQMWEVII